MGPGFRRDDICGCGKRGGSSRFLRGQIEFVPGRHAAQQVRDVGEP